jgi:hypothetical protein
MTPVAAGVARLPDAVPRQALFLPGFWLYVDLLRPPAAPVDAHVCI